MRFLRIAVWAGLCLLLLQGYSTPVSAPAVKLPSTVNTASSLGAGWPTYHLNNARTGADSAAPTIVSSAPNRQWNTPVDGRVYAEPLEWNGMVIAVTENDSVYALNETTGAVVWHVVAGASVPTHYCSSEINPVGITSTPVIDTTAGIVYAVGLVAGPPIRWQMFAKNLADGSNATGFPVDIAPTVATSTGNVTLGPIDEQRGALGLANGRIYVPFGGWVGDCGSYHPWVVSVPTTGGAVDHDYMPQTSTQREAGIWASQGMAIDGSGNIYVATGNGAYGSGTPCSNANYDHGNGVFKLSATLAEVSMFAPSDWCSLSASDTDVGSIAPALLNNGVVAQLGKSAQLWLMNSASLGGFGGQANSTTALGSCSSGDAIFGGTAYAYPHLYFACNSSGNLESVSVNSGTPPLGFATDWAAGGFTPGPPIVEGGLIWTLDIGGSALYGYDAAGNRVATASLPQGVVHFATPSADGDWIFVPQTGSITGLDFSPYPPPSCGANPCQLYSVEAYGGVHPAAFSPAIGNQPYFSWTAVRAAHMAPADTPGVTPPQAGLELDAYGGFHPYGSPALVASQYPYYAGFDIARDFALLPNGSGGYELDGYGGIHPFSLNGNALPAAPVNYPYFGRDVASKIVLLADGKDGYVLDIYGGIHPWAASGGTLPAAPAAYGYWAGCNCARDIWVVPASTTGGANGYVVDLYGGFHPFWGGTSGAPSPMVNYPYWSGKDLSRALWFFPSASAAGATGYELDAYGGWHPFASAGQTLPSPISQYSYWSGQDIAKALIGA